MKEGVYIIKNVKANLKQALLSRGFLMAAAAAAFVLLLSSVEGFVTAFRSSELLMFNYHTEFILTALNGNVMTLALPILCALPYTAAFVDDIKSGFYKLYLSRTTVGGYIAGKITACALAGALAILLGILAAWGIEVLVFLPKEAAPVEYITSTGENVKNVASPLWEKLLLYGISAAFWSLVGMLFATLTNSKYMAYASPFVIYYVLIILNERYFSSMYVVYPKEWLNPSVLWEYGSAGVILVIGEYIAVTALCTALAARRRLRNA